MTTGAKLGISAVAAGGARSALPALVSWSRSAEAASNVPPAALVEPAKGNREVAVLAGGCFWGVEAVFEHVKGVSDVHSGFAGGQAAGANYEKVSTGTTGNAEAVRIVFDPTKVSYAELLRIFFSVVARPDPGQSPGPGRRPAISHRDFPAVAGPGEGRERLSRAASEGPSASSGRSPRGSKTAGSSRPRPITRTSCARTPAHPYIVIHDRPKLAALKQQFPPAGRAERDRLPGPLEAEA